MSVHEPHGHGGSDVRSEEDRIGTVAILAVGVGSLLVFLLAGFVVTRYYLGAVRDPRPFPAEVGQSKIGMVEQEQFEVAVRGERDLVTRRERLGSFGWVDRPAGVAHMPIDRAMELVARGVRAKGGPGQEERRVPGGQP
jgi:hypothetical protein